MVFKARGFQISPDPITPLSGSGACMFERVDPSFLMTGILGNDLIKYLDVFSRKLMQDLSDTF